MQQILLFTSIVTILVQIIAATPNLKKDEEDYISTVSKIEKTMSYIYKNLQKTQSKEEVRFRWFPPRMGEHKGLYRSYIHLNAMDNKNTLVTKFIRNSGPTDMNSFVTNFVVYAILESFEYGGIEHLDENSLKIALEGLSAFQDKNYYHKIPMYTFWRQINVNGTWSQHPENMCEIVNSSPRVPPKAINILKKIGMGKLAGAIEQFQNLMNSFNYAYHIPADSDDTSIQMGLTGILHKFGEKAKNFAQDFINSNEDYKSLFKLLKYHSYRPFHSGDSGNQTFSNYSDLVDTRTYFWIHEFLTEKKSKMETKNLGDILLPFTWVFDYNMQKVQFPIQSMPFSVNNVDLNVAANFLFGITNIVLYHKDQQYITEAFDKEMQAMYKNTVDLIIYALKSKWINKRPDLAFLYYPSIFDFYWLVTRTYNTIKNFIKSDLHFFNEEIRVFFAENNRELETVLKNEATEQMLKELKKENGNYYFMEFLGNYGNKTRGEDMMFATGLGLNSLLNIWTTTIYTKDHNVNKIAYDEDSHGQEFSHGRNITQIQTVIDKLVNHVIVKFDSHFLSLQGAFFSGSVKSLASLEYFFPSNFNEYHNGTLVDDITDPRKITERLAAGVRGYVSEQEYSVMLTKVYYGLKVPTEFLDLNTNAFPFWSSPSVAYSANLIALSKYRKLRRQK